MSKISNIAYRELLNKYENYDKYKEDIDFILNIKFFIIWADEKNIDIKVIPRDIKKLKNITKLKIKEYRNISNLPTSIGYLKNLEKLIIWDCNLKMLPESISHLSKLEVLNIMYNQVDELPECIGELKKLKGLFIDYNKIKILPENIGNLENLEELGVANLKFQSLPKSLNNLKKIKHIRVRVDETKPYRYLSLSEFIKYNKSSTIKEKFGSYLFWKWGVYTYF